MTIPIEAPSLIKERQAIPSFPVTPGPDSVDFAPGLESAFPDQFQEYDCLIDAPGNRLPDFFGGTYYFNGPARFGSKDFSYRHWLDGDGMVCLVRFEKDAVRLRSR